MHWTIHTYVIHKLSIDIIVLWPNCAFVDAVATPAGVRHYVHVSAELAIAPLQLNGRRSHPLLVQGGRRCGVCGAGGQLHGAGKRRSGETGLRQMNSSVLDSSTRLLPENWFQHHIRVCCFPKCACSYLNREYITLLPLKVYVPH